MTESEWEREIGNFRLNERRKATEVIIYIRTQLLFINFKFNFYSTRKKPSGGKEAKMEMPCIICFRHEN
jgi:hypothetical protein